MAALSGFRAESCPAPGISAERNAANIGCPFMSLADVRGDRMRQSNFTDWPTLRFSAVPKGNRQICGQSSTEGIDDPGPEPESRPMIQRRMASWARTSSSL